MRIAIVCAAVALMTGNVFAGPPYNAPISQNDVRQISRAIRGVTSKPIRFIMAIDEDKPVAGAVVTGDSFVLDLKTGKRTYRYTRTDLVSVYMQYTDPSHVDVYTVRKVAGQWKIEKKSDWFL